MSVPFMPLLALLMGAGALAGAWWLGRRRWRAHAQHLLARLAASRVPVQPPTVDLARDLAGLPPVVQRWFRATLTDGMPRVAAVQLAHQGQFNLGDDAPAWRPFTSTQRVQIGRPGFVWDARIRLMPGLQVHVHDAYLAGEGLLHPAVAGLLSLADLHGGGALARGELMRYVAEAAWYPSALLPGPAVQWWPVDAQQARVQLSDGPLTVALTLRFDDQARLVACRADARDRRVGTQMQPTPWEGRWWDHRQVQGQVVPMQGEVAWLLPQGRQPYWRGRVTALHVEPAP